MNVIFLIAGIVLGFILGYFLIAWKLRQEILNGKLDPRLREALIKEAMLRLDKKKITKAESISRNSSTLIRLKLSDSTSSVNNKTE